MGFACFVATTQTKRTPALLPATHSVDLFCSRCRTEHKFARELASFIHASSELTSVTSKPTILISPPK